jgi:hypothetical protein
VATVVTRVIVAVICDDGREFTWDEMTENAAPDDTFWVGIVAQASINMQAEEAARAVESSGVGKGF